MKVLYFISFLFFIHQAFAQESYPPKVNYDESKVPNYELPDLLTCNDGTKVKTVKDWEQKRRPEIMNLLMSELYGKTPTDKIDVDYKLLASDANDLDGTATSKQVLFTFRNGQKVKEAILLLYIPNNVKGKVPAVITYNFMGNTATSDDENVLSSIHKTGYARGSRKSRFPYRTIVSRGYAVATMCYHDIFPDHWSLRNNSVAALFPDYEQTINDKDLWGSIGVWAWGYSRIADYLETESAIDKNRIAVMGHSRQGKAALWAGAQDKRFKVVISNNSGCGGAALFKREFGEDIKAITDEVAYWFCPTFKGYSKNEQALPFDQHMLLSLVAPRHVYVASAEEDLWADPKGEYLALYHAKDVYKLYKMKPITKKKQPAVNKPVHKDVGYHIRSGKHCVTDFDWKCYLDYCDKYMK